MIKTSIKKQQSNNNINTKPPNVSNYLKSLSQEAKLLMDEIGDADDDINNNKLLFIGSDKEKFNFNIFSTPLSFLSAIYNGEILLKETEISQRKIKKKIEELNGYRPENAEENRRKNWCIDAGKWHVKI